MDPVARFRDDLARLLPQAATERAPLALAVSGGPDSMAMLWLSAQAVPGMTVAATVDHCLRREAAEEAEVVAATCASLGVPHATLRTGRPIQGGNLHAAARADRYALLARWAADRGATALATAHQLDDQAETFLMRAVRGSGPAGLAGVRARRPEGDLTIIRPLLGWRRGELAAIAEAGGMPIAIDPSNTDERFERARVRRLLTERPWLDAAGLASAAKHVAEAEEAMAATVDWLWRTRAQVREDEVLVEVGDLPRELCRRLARKALSTRSATSASLPTIEPLLAALRSGRAATQGDVLVRPDGAVWHFTKAPPHRHPGSSAARQDPQPRIQPLDGSESDGQHGGGSDWLDL